MTPSFRKVGRPVQGARRFYRARLTGKGQVQVPKAVREFLGAGRGDDLVFKVEESGCIYVICEPKRSLSDLAGILTTSGPAEANADPDVLSDSEEDISASEAVERDRRAVSQEVRGSGRAGRSERG